MLSLTEGTGVGGCGACVSCAPVAPWSALALSGKLGSDIVTNNLVNVWVNQNKTALLLQRWRFLCAELIELLSCS